MATIEALTKVASAPYGEGSRIGRRRSDVTTYLYRAAGDTVDHQHNGMLVFENSSRKPIAHHPQYSGSDSFKKSRRSSLQIDRPFGPVRPFGPIATPTKINARVSKDMRIFTKDGCPRLSDVVDREISAWSGRRWVDVRVTIAPSNPTQFYRIKLNNGTCLICTGDHPWAVVVDGQIVPILTQDLYTDLTISSFTLFNTTDLCGTEVPQAYEMGTAFGQKTADNYKPKEGLPAQIFQMSPSSLGQFVAGWMDSQKGTLFGSPEAIHDLQIVICRLGIHYNYVEDLGTFYTLGLSQENGTKIPNPKGSLREYRRMVSSLPRIIEVFAIGGGQKRAYTITSTDPGVKTVVLDGILTLC